MVLKKEQLLEKVVAAIEKVGWNVLYLSRTYPFEISIFNSAESHRLKISIYNITHGGGPARSPNEYRIQFKEPELFLVPGVKWLILGYNETLEVFGGWDIRKHVGPVGYSASFQIRLENLEAATRFGFSPCEKDNQEIAIAFQPDFLVEYVRHLEELHDFGVSADDFNVLARVTEREAAPDDPEIDQVAAPRQKIVRSVLQTQRDSSFRERVLRAYNFKCAFSGIQLNLVDAAHIVPVAIEGSTDQTSNGIALSKLHHKAYDAGLITFDENYRIHLNEEKFATMEALSLNGGAEIFRERMRTILDLPPNAHDRPHVDFVRRANELREWTFE